jgi:AraC-like DNA-binding protein
MELERETVEKEISPQLSELRDLIARHTSVDGVTPTAIASLFLIRYSSPLTPTRTDGLSSPMLCVAVQGQKDVVMGGELYSYGPGHHLVLSLAIPVSARILGATRDKPYLGLRFQFEPMSIGPLVEEARLPAPAGVGSERGFYLAPTPAPLLDAVLRFVRLLDSPAQIPVFAPMIEREILLRLLLDDSSVILHRMAQPESQHQRVAVAITYLRERYRQPMRVEKLARRAGMSPSSFHQWFRTITGISPLQYQKQLRLLEARTILRNERIDVGTVSRRVGYASASQFSREYGRFFGMPPVREIKRVA